MPREPKVAKLDPAIYDAYAGRYEAEVPGKEKEHKQFTVVRDGSRLFYEPKGKARFLLTPESDTLFYIKAGDSEARFVKDAAGKVTHLIVIDDGRELTARRLPAETHP